VLTSVTSCSGGSASRKAESAGLRHFALDVVFRDFEVAGFEVGDRLTAAIAHGHEHAVRLKLAGRARLRRGHCDEKR
jgi:hypothetical protein